MPRVGTTRAYRYFADRFYLDRANRDNYIARNSATRIALSGGLLLAGALDLGTNLINNVTDPSGDQDADTKAARAAAIATHAALTDIHSISRPATLVVATNDATTLEKEQADYVCDGTNDYIEIQAAIDACVSGNCLRIVGPNAALGATGLSITGKDRFMFDARNTLMTCSSTGAHLTVNGASATSWGRNVIIANIEAVGAAIASATAQTLKLAKFNMGYIDLYAYDYQGGTGVYLDSTTGQCEANDLHLKLRVCKKGIDAQGTGSLMNNNLWLEYDPYNIASSVAFETGSYAGTLLAGWHINKMGLWIQADVVSYGINGALLKGSIIDDVSLDGMGGSGNGYVLFNGCSTTLRVRRVNKYGVHASLLLKDTYGGPTIEEVYTDQVLTERYLSFRPVVGQYMLPVGISVTSSTKLLVANEYSAIPITIDQTMTLDRISFRVETLAAGKVARAGIYTDLNGVPSKLVVDGGEISVATTGAKEATISTVLAPGTYWLVLISDGAPTVLGADVGTANQWMVGLGSTLQYKNGYWTKASTYGALPATFPASPAYSGSGTAPGVWLRPSALG